MWVKNVLSRGGQQHRNELTAAGWKDTLQGDRCSAGNWQNKWPGDILHIPSLCTVDMKRLHTTVKMPGFCEVKKMRRQD